MKKPYQPGQTSNTHLYTATRDVTHTGKFISLLLCFSIRFIYWQTHPSTHPNHLPSTGSWQLRAGDYPVLHLTYFRLRSVRGRRPHWRPNNGFLTSFLGCTALFPGRTAAGVGETRSSISGKWGNWMSLLLRFLHESSCMGSTHCAALLCRTHRLVRPKWMYLLVMRWWWWRGLPGTSLCTITRASNWC